MSTLFWIACGAALWGSTVALAFLWLRARERRHAARIPRREFSSEWLPIDNALDQS